MAFGRASGDDPQWVVRRDERERERAAEVSWADNADRRPFQQIFLGHGASIAEELLAMRRQRLPYSVGMAKKKSSAQRSSAKKTAKDGLKVVSSKVVYKGKVFSVARDEVKEPNGVSAIRDVIRHSGSVVVLAVDESGREPRILLEHQYRYAAQEYLWELPAGRIDPGETPLAGAKRELIEETGYRAKRWKRVLHFYASPGFLDETMDIFLARQLTLGEAQPEEDESIECYLVPLSDAIEMVFNGKIHDGKAIAGILWLAEARRNGSF
jgi:ADP-ribose pyrophosphatase